MTDLVADIMTAAVTKQAYEQPAEQPSAVGRFFGSAPGMMLAGGTGGALLGRYLAAPVISKLTGLDPGRIANLATVLGGAAGLTPGLQSGLAHKALYGNFMSQESLLNGPPSLNKLKYGLGVTNTHSPYDRYRPAPQTSYTLPNPHGGEIVMKQAEMDPSTYDEALWNPTFPVAQSMEEIDSNPVIPFMQKVKMKQLIAHSGHEQGVGLTGLASPGALIAALPRVVANAVPTVGGAWAVSELLGAPPTLKKTMLGGALIYSALKGFMGSR